MTEQNQCYILLGSNMGDRGAMLSEAKKHIEGACGKILRSSSVYISKAWGIENQKDFQNQVVKIETALSALGLLRKLLQIEQDMGRKRMGKWLSRVIDLDILFYNTDVIETAELIVPHPKIAVRNFTLVPLMEISQYMIHPVLGVTIEELYLQSEDTLEVLMIES